MKISKRELVRQSVRHKSARPIPFHMPLLVNASQRIKDYFNVDDIHLATGDYIDWNIGIDFGRKWKDKNHWEDAWGVIWKDTKVNRGYIARHPIIEPDSRKIPNLPEIPLNATEDIKKMCNRLKELYLIGWCDGLFERAHFLRGMENFMMDLYLNTGFVERLLDKILESDLKIIAFFKELPVDCIMLSDDYGSQNNLLISPDKFKRFFKPRLKKIFTEIKNTNKAVSLHSDGNIEKIIPDLIETGVEILHPIQSDTMNIFSLKNAFGKDLCFYGGASTQTLLRLESPLKIKEKVRILKDKMSKNGGFILAPELDIQEDIPLENILAFVEVCNE